ncbi:MAG: carboxypeptidase-like regulatory domain-containing protein [Putridiphycobacter sp.]
MKKFLLLLVVSLFFNSLFSQEMTQNIRGKVIDVDTKVPLIGAKLKVVDITDKFYGAVTSVDGSFAIRNVPIGKHTVEITFVGYAPKELTVVLTVGKETILNIELEEQGVVGQEVVVTIKKKGEVNNDMSTVSSTSFSVEETNRFAGSRGDPARMMSNYAGAQGTDDSRNDIVVRGNSPSGILYRVEGINIPNPNHFAISGSGGGPVSILNNKFLGNSDFFMSAFPAEYGNSVSGVFDINLRNGNNSIHEFSGQFGFLGTEFQVEGPISKNAKSSYLLGGRYSTFQILKNFGISIGTDAVPNYYDGAFKFNFPMKNGGNLSFFGIGGQSQISILISDQTEPAQDAFGEQDRDQYFGTSMFVTGATYKKPINSKLFVKSTLAVSQESQHSHHEYIYRHLDSNNQFVYDAEPNNMMGFKFNITKFMGYVSFNQKINKKHYLRYGINVDSYLFNMHDSVRTDITDSLSSYQTRWDYDSQSLSYLIQPFFQWKFKINKKLVFNAGLHSQIFTFSNSVSPIEPRLGLKYNVNGNSVIAGGVGLHSQTQPMYTYTYNKFDNVGNKIYHNQNMDFTKSLHSVLSYSLRLNKSMRFKSEVYYQYLYNVPVEIESSAFSLLNQGSGFARFFPDSLQNTGTGENYGIEFTLEKFFDQSFFFMTTVSLYESKYRGSDGVLRNTDFNGNYIVNGLAGKEFKLGKKDNQTLAFGIKVTYAGGKRYGIVDTVATNAQKEIIFLDSAYNTLRFKDYFRFDAKVNYTLNTKKVTHEFGLDLVNMFNITNYGGLTYVPNEDNPAQPYEFRKQLGFLPLFYYKIEFKIAGKPAPPLVD